MKEKRLQMKKKGKKKKLLEMKKKGKKFEKV